MLSQLIVLLVALLSRFDPAAVDSIELAERIDTSASVDTGEALAAIQVDLLPDREAALALADTIGQRLDDASIELEVFVEAVAGELELPLSYRVGIGTFADFEDAERARAALGELGIDGFVRELELVIGC